MSTLIAFSGNAGDCTYVEEDLETVTSALARGASGRASGFSELTQIPTQSDSFDKGIALVNAQRIAFIRAA
jgi:hypothetical protein